MSGQEAKKKWCQGIFKDVLTPTKQELKYPELMQELFGNEAIEPSGSKNVTNLNVLAVYSVDEEKSK